MKILQISSARQLGGGEKHLADLTDGLARSGHEVYAAVVPGSPLIAELAALSKENIIELPMRNALNIASVLQLARLVRTQQIEIIHAHVARDYPLAALISQRSGTRLVLTRHVLFPMNRIHRLTLRRTSRIIAVSAAVAAALREQGIFEADKIICIHNGIDVARFENARPQRVNDNRRASKNFRIGMVGHLAPIKGTEEFIRAAAIVCGERDDVEFIIAGEDKSAGGRHRRALEQLIAELNLRPGVTLLGWVDDVARLLPTFDLFVSPSRSEPFGLSIVEAMASGAPVVASRSEGALEIIVDNQTGRLIPIGDPESLAKVLLDLLSDENERRSLSQNAQRVVRERFSRERMLAATEEVYRRVLEA